MRTFQREIQRTLQLLQPVDENGLGQIARQVVASKDADQVLQEVTTLQLKLNDLAQRIKAEQNLR